MLNYNKDLKEYSRRLRKEMTDAERQLWARIRGKQLRGYQFYRQKPIGDFASKIPHPPLTKGGTRIFEAKVLEWLERVS